jgi:hypothetical protein
MVEAVPAGQLALPLIPYGEEEWVQLWAARARVGWKARGRWPDGHDGEE